MGLGDRWVGGRDSQAAKRAMDILIVENDADVRRLFADALDGDGHQVTIADFDALPVDRGFGLVLTDLPDGPFRAAKAREWVGAVRARYPGARLAICTAHWEAQREPDRLGADALLMKPFDLRELAALTDVLVRGAEDPPAP